jgi:chromosome segregation ATPase
MLRLTTPLSKINSMMGERESELSASVEEKGKEISSLTSQLEVLKQEHAKLNDENAALKAKLADLER